MQCTQWLVLAAYQGETPPPTACSAIQQCHPAHAAPHPAPPLRGTQQTALSTALSFHDAKGAHALDTVENPRQASTAAISFAGTSTGHRGLMCIKVTKAPARCFIGSLAAGKSSSPQRPSPAPDTLLLRGVLCQLRECSKVLGPTCKAMRCLQKTRRRRMKHTQGVAALHGALCGT